MSEKLCCPRCSSDQIVKVGKHYNLKGAVQCHRCKLCGTSFSNHGYFRGGHTLTLLQYASVLYQNGCSYEKIAHKIYEEFHEKVSDSTICRWINKLGVKVPEKFLLLDNVVVKEAEVRG